MFAELNRALVRVLLTSFPIAALMLTPAQAQLTVIDPANLVQTALTAARTLEQINNQVMQITNQVQQLENEAKNLTKLGQTFAPEILGKLEEMDQVIEEGRGLALKVSETRLALEGLYSGDYRGTDMASRAQLAARQIDNARAALQTSLIFQAKASEQLAEDKSTLGALAAASLNADGALSAQQATNELLSFQAEQAMRLEELLVAKTRAEALEQARAMEVRAQGRAQHDHFFGSAANAYPGAKPWN